MVVLIVSVANASRLVTIGVMTRVLDGRCWKCRLGVANGSLKAGSPEVCEADTRWDFVLRRDCRHRTLRCTMGGGIAVTSRCRTKDRVVRRATWDLEVASPCISQSVPLS